MSKEFDHRWFVMKKSQRSRPSGVKGKNLGCNLSAAGRTRTGHAAIPQPPGYKIPKTIYRGSALTCDQCA